MSETHSEVKSSNSYRWWVRVSHWLITLSFFGLVFTSVEILMVHPRLYWSKWEMILLRH